MNLNQDPESVEEDEPDRTQAKEPAGMARSAQRKPLLLMAFGLPKVSTEQRIGWLNSEERQRVIRVFAWLIVANLLAIILTGLVTYFYVGASPSEYDSSTRSAFQASGFASLISIYSLFGFSLYRRTQFSLYRDRIELEQARGEVRDAETKLTERDGPHLDFASLWDVTAKRLDYYHEIATQQANASFRRAQLAIGRRNRRLRTPAAGSR